MVKKETTESEFIKAAKITVKYIVTGEKNDSIEKYVNENTYLIFANQLVSILYIDPLTGKANVYRGRVEDITSANLTASRDPDFIKLDVSTKSKSKMVTLAVERILQVNPIDYKYNNIDAIIIDPNSQDWHEENKEVSAPSSVYAFRFN